MLRDQMFGFLQTAIVFLLLTNAVSALVAFYAMKTANALARPGQQTKTAIERKLEAVLARADACAWSGRTVRRGPAQDAPVAHAPSGAMKAG